MKKILVLLVGVIVLLSCSDNDDKIDSINFPQKWQLKKMSGQFHNSEIEGIEMEWQEIYTLNDDGTFNKLRERNNVISEVTGTFVFLELLDGKFLILTHQADNELIGSCLNKLEEELWVKSNNKMIGTWQNCDGPGLEYERIN